MVKQAVEEGTKDSVLGQLLEVTRAAIIESRELFRHPMEEPVFFRRYFKRWVREAIEQKKKVNDILQEEMKRAIR